MTKLVPLFGLSLAFALTTACSSTDPGITGSHGSRGSGSVGGNGSNGGNNGGNNNNNGGGGGKPTPSPPPPDYDAGPSPGGADYDSGTPTSRDSGGGTRADSGTQGAPLGSCGNPRCGGFGQGGDCGCVACDSNGVQIQLVCNGAQGICACFSNGAQTTDVIDAPNVCDSNADTANVFIASCGCQ